MTKILLIIAVIAAAAAGGLRLWRLSDSWAQSALRDRLLERVDPAPEHFDPTMLKDLGPVARRFFLFAIKPGTPIRRVVEIQMRGTLSLGSTDAPSRTNIRADQVLAAPDGFVWGIVATGDGMRISGFDGAENEKSWTRFWVKDFIPVARDGSNQDHARSAFGRLIAEAAIWTPAALLPSQGIRWEDIDKTTTRVTVTHGKFIQSVDLTIAEDGQPEKLVLPRWSNANPDRVYRIQPFGGFLSGFREFDGYRLPTRIEAGNHFGSDAYFPFYRVTVTEIRFVVMNLNRTDRGLSEPQNFELDQNRPLRLVASSAETVARAFARWDYSIRFGMTSETSIAAHSRSSSGRIVGAAHWCRPLSLSGAVEGVGTL